MSFKRSLWRSTGVGWIIDAKKNIEDEGNFQDGLKKTIKEDYCEDNFITSKIYKEGCYDGKQQGYSSASDQYELKLLKQADEFMREEEIYKKERNEYEALLDSFDEKIDSLLNKDYLTNVENQYLFQLLVREYRLRKHIPLLLE